jgi:CBS domain-containing protein
MVMSKHGIPGLPVVGAQGQLLGVVSEGDILFKEGAADQGGRSLWGWVLGDGVDAEQKLAARTVGEAMTSPAIPIDAGRSVYEAAQKMAEHGVNRLPVLDEGALVGIVTRADLVRAFTRTDTEIRHEIRDDIMLHTLWMDPDLVDVTVSKGEVTLTGQVDTQSDAELLARLVGHIPGVVAVKSSLTW